MANENGREIKAKIVFDTSGIAGAVPGDMGAVGGKETAKRTSKSLDKISRFLLGGQVDSFLKGAIKNSALLAGAAATGAVGSQVLGGISAGVDAAASAEDTGNVFEDLNDAASDLTDEVLDGGRQLEKLADDAENTRSPLFSLSRAFSEGVTTILRFLAATQKVSDEFERIASRDRARANLSADFGTERSPVFVNRDNTSPISSEVSIGGGQGLSSNPLTPSAFNILSIPKAMNITGSMSQGKTTTSKFMK